MIRQSIDMSKAPCLLCKYVERRKHRRRVIGVRLFRRLRLLDQHELTSSQMFWSHMSCVGQWAGRLTLRHQEWHGQHGGPCLGYALGKLSVLYLTPGDVLPTDRARCLAAVPSVVPRTAMS
jgi:hypothetical protein